MLCSTVYFLSLGRGDSRGGGGGSRGRGGGGGGFRGRGGGGGFRGGGGGRGNREPEGPPESVVGKTNELCSRISITH